MIYEIKSSASGKIPDAQLARLRGIQRGDIRRIWTALKWKQSTNQLVENKAYLRHLDGYNVLGLKKVGTTLAITGAIVGFAQVDEAFAQFEQAIFDVRDSRDITAMPFLEGIAVQKFKELLDAASGGTSSQATDLVMLGYTYRRLIPRMAEPHWQGNAGD